MVKSSGWPHQNVPIYLNWPFRVNFCTFFSIHPLINYIKKLKLLSILEDKKQRNKTIVSLPALKFKLISFQENDFPYFSFFKDNKRVSILIASLGNGYCFSIVLLDYFSLLRHSFVLGIVNWFLFPGRFFIPFCFYYSIVVATIRYAIQRANL